MRHFLLAVGLLLALGAQAQRIPGKQLTSYTTKRGTVIHVGDTLTLGQGQRENGSFKYATIPPNMMVTAGMAVPPFWSNKKVVVRDIREQQVSNGLNRDVAIVFKSGVYNAKMDADAAEQSGELVTKYNQQKATPAGAGVADELIKLKSLLDSGAITQAEFDAQKAKLLGR